MNLNIYGLYIGLIMRKIYRYIDFDIYYEYRSQDVDYGVWLYTYLGSDFKGPSLWAVVNP